MTPIPSFIYQKKNQITMVLLVPLYALAFILIYRPFNIENLNEQVLPWLNEIIDPNLKGTLLSLVVVLIGMAVAAISRVIMTAYTKKHAISYVGYIIWVALEIVIMTLIYTIVSVLLKEQANIVSEFRNTLTKTILILLIPYVMMYIYFIWQERVRELKSIRKRLEEDENALQKAYIQIFDEKGKLQLSVRREHLIVIESADNYVCVWYLNGETTKKVMVRTTLKQVAEQLAHTNILRCHRSYMINLDRVRVLRREKEGIFVEFGIEDIPDIPISKTYSESITRWLMSEQRS
ncbi:MAG: LytTR family transcriptional regulator DNA-binding domain-containing protein [Alistipes sp.]|nr:LytTR family transcriptional regulator DNA-binding domain-containing protein [Alistipes sp.]MBR3846173.1 LytTR family transcriptional regulator DNA-binding domain-containing protein [Alistipes sp.]MBR7169297.1 LytTR family transcriptional regulator DNA-binding domain-containing protein [Alistipes sp.]